MSIKPIDLQVNFSQMNHVGRDQAAIKNAELHKDLVAGQEIAQESVDSDSKVLKTEKSGEELKVGDEHKGRNSSNQNSNSEEDDKEDEIAEKKKSTLFDDPAVGKHLDLSG